MTVAPTTSTVNYRRLSGVAQFQARHPADTRTGLAMALLLFTLQRRGDVVRMGWQHVTELRDEQGVLRDHIAVRQERPARL